MGVDVLPPKAAAERATTMAALRCLMPVASEEEEEEEKKRRPVYVVVSQNHYVKTVLHNGFAKTLCKSLALRKHANHAYALWVFVRCIF